MPVDCVEFSVLVKFNKPRKIIKSNLCKSILLSWRENYISEEKSIMLSISWLSIRYIYTLAVKDKRHTLYNASWISWNCSDVKVPGSTPLTSRPKSANLDASAEAGRTRGMSSMVIRVMITLICSKTGGYLWIPFMIRTSKIGICTRLLSDKLASSHGEDILP